LVYTTYWMVLKTESNWSGGWDRRNKGWFATELALITAFPVWEDGRNANVWSTDTIRTWDTDSNAWVDTGIKPISDHSELNNLWYEESWHIWFQKAGESRLLNWNTLWIKKTLGSIDNYDFWIITNNTERLTIKNDGKVVIWWVATSSTADLTIVSSASAGKLRFQNSGTWYWATDWFAFELWWLQAYVWNYENDLIYFWTNNLTRMTIAADGKVGIGTAPWYKLDVNWDINISDTYAYKQAGVNVIKIPSTSLSSTVIQASNFTWTGANNFIAGSGAGNALTTWYANIAIWTSALATATTSASNVAILRRIKSPHIDMTTRNTFIILCWSFCSFVKNLKSQFLAK